MMVLESFFDLIFGWAVNINPLFGMVFISLILTLLVTLIYKYTTNQKAMKELKDELKSLQGKMKEHKEDNSKMMEIQKEAMEKNIKYMKHTFVPMILTFLPIIIIFGWIKLVYDPLGKIFFMFGWLGTYIIFSIIFSYGLRKILKVY